jgi:hypothetical protein
MIEDDSGERREGARGNEMLWRMEGVICHWNEANESKKLCVSWGLPRSTVSGRRSCEAENERGSIQLENWSS